MIVSAIAAMDRRGLIGNGGKLPWHLPRDLKRFRRYTLGKPVILGRRTLESLGHPLPDRLNIVLTHNPSMREEGFRVARSVDEALSIAKDHLESVGTDEAMIIGGGVVFEATCHLWDRLLLTVVDGVFEGDTYFPLEQVKTYKWRTLAQECCTSDSKNQYAHWFVSLERLRDALPDQKGFELAGLFKELAPARGARLSHR